MQYILYVIIALLISSGPETTKTTGTLHVVVKGLRNPNGWVVCHLFNSGDGYPTKSKKAMKFLNDFDLKDSIAEFTFTDLPNGEYAFTVHHDENGNKKMDKNFFGLPSEGWACSNNAKGILGVGLPSFEKARIEIKGNTVEQEITINY